MPRYVGPCDEYDCEDGIVSNFCPNCNGSGEGMYDGSTCRRCKGSGEIKYECEVCKGKGYIISEEKP